MGNHPAHTSHSLHLSSSPHCFSNGNPAPAFSSNRPSLEERISIQSTAVFLGLPSLPRVSNSPLSPSPFHLQLTRLPLRHSLAECSSVIDELRSSGWQAGGQPARDTALTRQQRPLGESPQLPGCSLGSHTDQADLVATLGRADYHRAIGTVPGKPLSVLTLPFFPSLKQRPKEMKMVNFLKLGMAVIQPCHSVQVFIISPFIHLHMHATRAAAVGISTSL